MDKIKQLLPKKGHFGYLIQKKSYDLTRTIVIFGVALTIFFSGLNMYDTKKNLFSILAVLIMLPAAKSAVGYIISRKAAKTSCSRDLYDKMLEITEESSLKMSCDYYMTSYNQNFAVSCLVYGNGCLIGLSGSDKTDCTACEKHIEKYLSNDSVTGITVKIFSSNDKFLARASELAGKMTTSDPLADTVFHILQSISV